MPQRRAINNGIGQGVLEWERFGIYTAAEWRWIRFVAWASAHGLHVYVRIAGRCCVYDRTMIGARVSSICLVYLSARTYSRLSTKLLTQFPIQTALIDPMQAQLSSKSLLSFFSIFIPHTPPRICGCGAKDLTQALVLALVSNKGHKNPSARSVSMLEAS